MMTHIITVYTIPGACPSACFSAVFTPRPDQARVCARRSRLPATLNASETPSSASSFAGQAYVDVDMLYEGGLSPSLAWRTGAAYLRLQVHALRCARCGTICLAGKHNHLRDRPCRQATLAGASSCTQSQTPLAGCCQCSATGHISRFEAASTTQRCDSW